jgi:type IV secretion system protein VirB10
MAEPATQNAPAAAGQGGPAPTGQNAGATSAQAITVPTGTTIQLTLMSAIKSKSTKAGDTVRAVVAFPVTIGTQLAIPAGTFMEGVVGQVTARPKGGQQPSFRVHFTRLVFANGYSAALNGENTQALALPPENGAQNVEVAELLPMQLPGTRFAMGEGQQTQLPTLPREGPNPAVIGGAMGGAFVAILVGMLIWAHHRANSVDFVLYDAGWQFQMVLDSPVTLDAAQVAAAAAAAAPSAN